MPTLILNRISNAMKLNDQNDVQVKSRVNSKRRKTMMMWKESEMVECEQCWASCPRRQKVNDGLPEVRLMRKMICDAGQTNRQLL